METSRPVKTKIHSAQKIIYMILLAVTVSLLIVIITGTIIGLVRQSSEPLINIRAASQSDLERITSQSDDVRVFSGLGRLRIPLVNSSTLILSIAFPYLADDVTFTEELASKIIDLRTQAADYFAGLPEESLIQIDEDAAKREILRRYNAILRLGRIEILYFNDMIIID